jgi:RimJ/RimL family protein N-acetyltransferase
MSKSNKRMVGSINLMINRQHERAELSFSVARPMWGQGIATEAAQAVIRSAFEELRMAKITASTDARNVASRRVLKKLSMQQEGHFRSHRVNRGERIDEVHFGLLRSEWEAGLAAP